MAGTISVDGLISGLKTSEIIDQLAAAYRAPITQLEEKKESYTTKLNLWQTINTKLLALKSSALELSLSSTFLVKRAIVAGDALSVSPGSGAQEGTYVFTVESLAKVHQIATALAYADTDTTRFGEGTITIAMGGKVTEIAIDASNNTLSGIRDAINRAGAGVKASIVKTSEGYRLLLVGEKAGTENAVTVDVALSGGEALLSEWTTIQEAQNARVLLGGTNPIVYEGTSNVVTDFIPGMTLNLRSTGTVTVTVSRDPEAVKEKILAFTNALRDFLKFVKENTFYNAETRVAGALLGDSTLSRIVGELVQRFTDRVASGTYRGVMDVGISLDRYGDLSVDEGKLTQALESDLAGVQALFAGTGGIASSINDYLRFVTSPAGGIVSETRKFYQNLVKNLDERITLMEERLEAQKERWMRQFAALEAYLGTMQTQSNWLTQQIANLNKLVGRS